MKKLVIAKRSWNVIPLLINPGYCLFQSRISDGNLNDRLQPLMNTFIEMINLPAEERKMWEIDADQNGDSDDGLIERDGGVYDHKFLFHFKDRVRMAAAMVKTTSYQKDPDKWSRFLNTLNTLHINLSEDMDNIVHSFDHAYPKYQLLEKVRRQGSIRGILRLIYYKPGHSVAAKPHYDKSLFTFHVADSHPGLLVGKENELSKKAYVSDQNNLLMFPGMKAEIATDGLIPAARHAAIANEKAVQEGRWSIVFFYHCNVGISSPGMSCLIKQKLQTA